MENSNKITVTVDGIDVLVEQGSSVLQACEVVGIEIPRFCFHERLLIAGNCRMCLVEIEKSPKPQASCAIPVMPGMKVFTDTPLVKKAREGVLEFLLLNHPLDCPICDQGGECDLQDQAMVFGSDRSRFFERKRGVEDKNLGPLVKTIMTRCIHCTRCVRFATEVAGVEVLGTTSRGIDTEIGTYVEKMFDSELSGNIIDLCPVGALTSKPYAFTSRPWELRLTESVDVMDSVGSNIRVDTRGTEIMRIIPRLNEEINEEWISDKTRFSYDGLKRQRLTKPMVRDEKGNLVSVEWLEAFDYIKKNVNEVSMESNEVAGIIGGLVDVETIFTLKKFISQYDSSTVVSEFGGGKDLQQDFLTNHTFNSSIQGIEESDLILLVGTNPRKEAAIINARIRKRSLQGNFKVAYVGPTLDKSTQFGLNYPVDHLGKTAETISQIASGQHSFCSELVQASNPIIIVGSNVLNRDDSDVVSSMLTQIDRNTASVKGSLNSILSVIQPNASQYGAAQLGLDSFNPSFEETPLKLVYCVGVEDLNSLSLDDDSFVIYQGHHGNEDVALYADVILPGAAYTEKDALFFNTEGRPQSTKRALTPPGYSREDWKIVSALSEYLHGTSQHASRMELLDTMGDKIPGIKSLGHLPAINSLHESQLDGKSAFIGDESLYSSVPNFYFTCSVTKASSTMAKCVELFTQEPNGALNPASTGK
jgi:NADH dehydrogenase (ubiquinone) Fe-S protein 1